MISVSSYLQVFGSDFSPSAAQERLRDTDVEISSLSNEDEAEEKEARISFDSHSSSDCGFEEGVADLLPPDLPIFSEKSLVQTLWDCGAEEIILYVTVAYPDQCNMELSPTLMSRLADMKVVLAITCYSKE